MCRLEGLDYTVALASSADMHKLLYKLDQVDLEMHHVFVAILARLTVTCGPSTEFSGKCRQVHELETSGAWCVNTLTYL